MLRPLTRRLAQSGVTPNQVTVVAALLSIATGAAITVWADRGWPLLLLPGILLIRMALNAIDGMLAREHNMRSQLGAVLNEVGDVVSDAALYLPLALVQGVSAPMIVALTTLAVIRRNDERRRRPARGEPSIRRPARQKRPGLCA